ncbi:MAG TPA: radical SAM protein [Candidatus Acidoferrales bacterium]|nr:radical SAM protein [Candidatus Acidoferrales bacterium]
MRGVEVLEKPAKSVLNAVKGMPFKWSINPYRGCFHQCVFCYARRTHSFLEEDGVAAWGRRIFVKTNAPAILRAELAKRSWRHEYVAIGTVTDPYQPLEGRYRLTRGVLEALRDYATPAGLITRSPLVIRDTDVISQLARTAGAHVSVSIATLDERLAREIEPTVAPPRQRLRAVRALAEAGIAVHVALAPVLPQITDSSENVEAVVRAARDAGACRIWHNTLYLHEITRDAFFSYLRARHPELVARYAQTYRGTYAPQAVANRIDRVVGEALRSAPAPHRATIQPDAAVQLSLL